MKEPLGKWRGSHCLNRRKKNIDEAGKPPT